MKSKLIAILLAALLFPLTVSADYTPQKREMRSAWVATVWRLDWPGITISETGNASQIKKQKDGMIKLLDSLYVNNFNAINFQVRSRCDAMYKSSYEPWSADLVSTRGMDPGWDPLEFVVEECHKRGLECHAWVNPYRYESVIGQWNDDPTCYRKTKPEWIMDVGSASILNPGLPEVTQRICDIIKEIVTNYDIDGLLFDDYFYLQGTNESHDGDLYKAYTDGGGKLSIGDWRRENVNDMVAKVYSTVKSTKPWVRFGVSPAGIACTDANVARSYGIPRCPTGSDWQYNGIFSDPIAWVSRGSLDFISPQIYWTLGNGTNYGEAAEWWSMVAHKWQRHLYVSHSISSLTLSSKAPGLSAAEEGMLEAKASGPNNTSYSEYANEVLANREYDQNDAPGSIFYSAKYIYNASPKFGHYLKNTVFNTPALVPAMTWQSTEAVGLVEDLQRSGSSLSWKGMDNMRYTVYAFPEEMPTANFMREAEYLLGVSYSNEFTIPAAALTGCRYAVCALDRYGNEYSPAILGVATEALGAPEAIFPIGGITAEVPFNYEWKPVEGATEYIVEIATDKEMKQRIDQRSTTTTSISTENFFTLPVGEPVYWRVRACGAGKADGVSEVYDFFASNLLIVSPVSGETGLSLTPTFVTSIPDRDVILEIATSEAFNDNEMVLTHPGKGQVTVPENKLKAASTYYARMRYTLGGVEKTCPIIQFTTLEMEPRVPVIVTPGADGILYSDQHITLGDVAGASQLRVEVSSSESFPARTSYISTRLDLETFTDPKTASEIKLGTKALVDGETYYVRAKSFYRSIDSSSKDSGFGPVVSFVYSSENSGIEDVVSSTAPIAIEGHNIRVLTDNVASIVIYDIAGAEAARVATVPAAGSVYTVELPAGTYIIETSTVNGAKSALKAVF